MLKLKSFQGGASLQKRERLLPKLRIMEPGII